MGDAWFAPIPRCETHGAEMKLKQSGDWPCSEPTWVCPGYDGEGCETVPLLDRHLVWTRIGDVTFKGRFGIQ